MPATLFLQEAIDLLEWPIASCFEAKDVLLACVIYACEALGFSKVTKLYSVLLKLICAAFLAVKC